MSVMQQDCVLYEKKPPIARIILNRPHVLNAMNTEMHHLLAAIWDDFESDDKIRVGIVKGAGERAFSVGQDLKELAALNMNDPQAVASFGSRGKPGWPRLTERFHRLKPLIAQVEGYAIGGGFELALACDIIIASEAASFALPEAKWGLIPGAGGVFRLTRQIPSRVALGYLMTGRSMSAARAFELGLVNEVVSQASLEQCVEAWVQDILSAAPLSLKVIQEAISKSEALPLAEAFSMNYDTEAQRMHSLDAQEGPRAFAEKRSPIWQGR